MSIGSNQYTGTHLEALQAVKRGKDRLALSLFEKSLEAAPGDINLLVDYAAYLKCLYRFRDSLRLLERARALAPLEATVVGKVAGIAAECRAPAKTLEWLQEMPDDAASLFQMAVLSERTGDLEKALHCIGRAEDLAGMTVMGRLLMARICLRNHQPAESLQITRMLVSKSGHSPQLLEPVFCAMGKAWDALGEYAQAYEAWQSAKQVLKPFSAGTLKKSRAVNLVYQEVLEKLDAGTLDQWRGWTPAADGPQPIMVTGYPRSGTTLIEHTLSDDMHLPSADENMAFADLVWRRAEVKELRSADFWSAVDRPDFAAVKTKNYRADYQAALAELSGAKAGAQWVIDKNPQLLMRLPAILRVFPSMPVVVIHRDPRDVILSCFAQPFGINSHSVHYLAIDSLARHLAMNRQASDKLADVLGEQLVTCSYEDLVENNRVCRKNTVERLQRAAPGTLPSETDEKTPRVSYSPTYAEVAKPVYQNAVGRWRNYREWIEPHLEPLQKWLDS